MGDILTGIVKGLSGFMLQDDPDVKIFNAQTEMKEFSEREGKIYACLLYTSPSPRDMRRSRMPSSA